MKFSEAVKALEVGKKVKMNEWVGSVYLQFIGDVLIDEEGEEREFCSDSFLANWEVYEEPVRMMSFSDMVKGLKIGKKYRRSHWDSCAFISKGSASLVLYTCLRQNVSCYWYPSVEDLEAMDWIEVKE